jgi:hypothetical protein
VVVKARQRAKVATDISISTPVGTCMYTPMGPFEGPIAPWNAWNGLICGCRCKDCAALWIGCETWH